MATNTRLSKFEGDILENSQLYKQKVEALQYATITRPKIAFSVNQVCQHMHSPLDTHWKAVKRILRYLQGTLQHGLVLEKSNSLALTGFCDANMGNNVDDRKSTSGSCVFLGLNMVSWAYKKHSVVARSTTEAEYRSLANTVAELVWIKSLLA